MGPELVVVALLQYATVFMIVGLLMGGAIRRGRVLAMAVIASAAVLGVTMAILAPVATAGLVACIAALMVVGPSAAVGHFIRKRFDADREDNGPTSSTGPARRTS